MDGAFLAPGPLGNLAHGPAFRQPRCHLTLRRGRPQRRRHHRRADAGLARRLNGGALQRRAQPPSAAPSHATCRRAGGDPGRRARRLPARSERRGASPRGPREGRPRSRSGRTRRIWRSMASFRTVVSPDPLDPAGTLGPASRRGSASVTVNPPAPSSDALLSAFMPPVSDVLNTGNDAIPRRPRSAFRSRGRRRLAGEAPTADDA